MTGESHQRDPQMMEPHSSQREQRVLVTGGSRGIGRGIADVLARRGHLVGCLARSKEPLDRWAEQVRTSGGTAETAAVDLRDPDAVFAACETIVAALGGIDALINNAGWVVRKGIEEISVEEWQQIQRTNVDGLFYATKAILPHFIEQKRGTYINVSSISGKVPLPGGSAYAASKYAVTGFSESLFHEVRDHGIRVSILFPGSVSSESTDREEWRISPEDVGETCAHILEAGENNCLHQVEIRPRRRPA